MNNFSVAEFKPNLYFKDFSSNWEEYALKDLVEIKGKSNKNLKKDDLIDEGIIPVYKNFNIINSTDSEFESYITKEKYYEVKTNSIIKGDIIFKDNTKNRGDSIVIENDVTAIYFSLIRIRVNSDKLDPYFLKYFFKSTKCINQNERFFPDFENNIGTTVLNNLKIKIPSLEEQKEIGYFLNLIDTKINNFLKIRDKHKLLAQSILNSVLNQENNVEYLLDDLIITSDGLKSPNDMEKIDNGEFKYVPSSVFKDDNLIIDSSYLENINLPDYEKHTSLRYNDIIIKEFDLHNEDVGVTFLFKDNLQNCYLTTKGLILRIKDYKTCDPLFLTFCLKTDNYFKQIETYCKDNRLKDNLLKLKISLPSLEVQKDYAILLSIMFEKTNKIQEQIDLLEEYKQGLIEQMFI